MKAPSFKTVSALKIVVIVGVFGMIRYTPFPHTVYYITAIAILVALSIYQWIYSANRPELTSKWVLSRVLYLLVFLAIWAGATWYWHSQGLK